MAVLRDSAKMAHRLNLCAACDQPSPGPIRRLYYQPRKHGPFFPLLEEQKKGEKSSLFSGGRVSVCTSCASHLLRQWAAFEKKWTPLGKRSYLLLADERRQRFKGYQGGASNDEVPKHLWWKAAQSLTTQPGIVDSLQPLGNRGNTGESPRAFSGLGTESQRDDTGHPDAGDRFRLAAQRVQRSNEEPSGFRDVVAMTQDMTPLYDSSRNNTQIVKKRDEFVLTPVNQSDWEDEEEMHDRLPQRLRESADVLIRKLAEIQYEENLRQSQETIREALDRVKKAQDRPRFVKSLRRDLKERLYRELEFRHRNRSLVEGPSRPALKKNEGSEDEKHKQILQELEREKEWQRRTEIMIERQEKMVRELRLEMKNEIKNVMEEQSKHYEEMKRILNNSRAGLPHSGSDHAYVSLDGSEHSGSAAAERFPASRKRRRRRRDLIVTENANTRSSTPEFYIQ